MRRERSLKPLMYQQFSMRFGPSSALWTPADITTSAWYDASDASTITDDAGAVEQLDDKGPNGFDATQTLATDKPTTGVNNINGLNVLNGTDTNQYLDITATSCAACFGVVRVQDAGSTKVILLGGTSADDPEFFVRVAAPQISFDGGGVKQGKYAIDGGDWSGFSNNHTLGSSIAGTPIILAGVFQDGGFTLDALMGRSDSALGPQSTEWFGECIWLPSEPPADDKARLEGYLAWKWDGGVAGTLVGNLPVDHPYKNAAPTV